MFWENAEKVPLEVSLSLTDDLFVLIYRYISVDCLSSCLLPPSTEPNCLKIVCRKPWMINSFISWNCFSKFNEIARNNEIAGNNEISKNQGFL